MARTVVLTDDLDGTDTEIGTIYFYSPLNGKFYEIDLSSKNRSKLYNSLAAYAAKGREITWSRFRANAVIADAAGLGPAPPNEAAVIREWAAKNGMTDLPSRGRVPTEVREAYYKAQRNE